MRAGIGSAEGILVELVALFHVGAGREGAVAVGPQHDDVDVVLGCRKSPEARELVEHRPVERVERLRSVESDRQDVAGQRHLHRLKASDVHGLLASTRTADSDRSDRTHLGLYMCY